MWHPTTLGACLSCLLVLQMRLAGTLSEQLRSASYDTRSPAAPRSDQLWIWRHLEAGDPPEPRAHQPTAHAHNMSAAALAAEIQTIAESSYPNRIVQTVAFAMLYYDFLLTLPLEVERYWTGGRSWASVFFFVNRYMAVLCHMPVVYEFFGNMPEERCRTLQLYHQLLAALTQLVVGTLLMLRTYALYNRNRRVVYVLSAICAVGGAISVWAILSVRGSPGPSTPKVSTYVGCDLRISQKQGYYLAAAWSSILAFDTTVFALTLWQALHVTGRTWSHSLFRVILRDGTVYFGVLAICYLSNIMTYIFVQPKHKGILTTLTNVLSTTLVTRMMLNIRNPDLLELPHRWPSDRSQDI
ncbi:hypothetical protein L226DRAFT_521645 [Lentinus tigrinus ALCF2SS1-7]|uniref:uncharacterized protein n=1 Tax=Lentinus tigrinus ALCF2SS1-7 TaxID=1328758 RepID=UPI001165F772|nr:hypothetical protein L226DRAFT_521645 [Lentinus tigrinus ALCF2SS1-7]